jgi:ParB family transcriptional regulator, chromosome partitioning protein
MMRKSLGRGLDALIQSTDPNASAENNGPGSGSANSDGGTQILMVAPHQIVPSPFQPRRYFDPEALEELVAAIKSQGIIEPLIVRPATPGADDARYELIAGERRLRAARVAGLTVVPVLLRELEDRGALEMSLVENLLREDLNAIEEGRAFVRLNREFGLTHEDIAMRIGKSRAYVTNQIRLMELPMPVIEMIGRGEITAGQVRPLLALNSPDAQIAEARRIADGKISSRRVEEIASARKTVRHGQGSRSAAGNDPNLNALAEAIQRALKRKVRIVRHRGKAPGRIEMEYYNEDDLTALAESLAGSTGRRVDLS